MFYMVHYDGLLYHSIDAEALFLFPEEVMSI